MTTDEAQRCWSAIEREIEEIYLARRPKMRSFEVHHGFAVARKAVIAIYKNASGYADLREAALRSIGR